MDKQHFDQLVKGVREMKRHMAGKSVRGVNLRTLQNWEQQRTQPTGPARALLKIVASNPKAIEALHE